MLAPKKGSGGNHMGNMQTGKTGARSQNSKMGDHSQTWGLELGDSISQSMRGTPLLARAVDVGTVAGHDDLRIGSVAAAPTHNKLGTAFSHQPEGSAKLPPVSSSSTVADAESQVTMHQKLSQLPLSKALSAPLARSGKNIMVDSTVLQGAMQTGHAPELLMTLLEQVCVLAMNDYAHVCTYLCGVGAACGHGWHAAHQPTHTCVHDLLPTHDLTLQTKAEEPLEPSYFKPGQSVWRSNALLLQDNWLYIVIVLLTCEYWARFCTPVQAHSLQVHSRGWPL